MEQLQIKLVDYREQLVAIENIRTKVFQEEQGIAAELEFDGFDLEATHLLAYLSERAVGTTRIRELDNRTAKIERLAVLPEARHQGIGTQLMKAALNNIVDRHYQIVVVHAQAYIKNIYQKLGFIEVEEAFTEAEIIHCKMVKKIS
jgi:predicted GNAT family N-acyltransferase